VQGGTVVKPLTGAMNDGPSDACVIKPIGTKGNRGLVISNGINPELGKIDPYHMAVSVVDEAIRNAVAAGADPDRLALLDNFCWGDPARPETLGALVEAARGCHDAALHFGAPFISGKDSLNNEYLGADGQRHAIPPTLLISAIGLIEDVTKAVTMDLKEAENVMYLIGEIPNSKSQNPKTPKSKFPREASNLYRTVHRAMQTGLIRACHDLSEGGLAVAAAEMCIGGRLGLSLTLDDGIFREVNGCLLAEVRPADCAAFESHFETSGALKRLGLVTAAQRLNISTRSQTLVTIPISDLVAAWNHVS
jgi:phosphoribosylformylglycinamidine synthase